MRSKSLAFTAACAALAAAGYIVFETAESMPAPTSSQPPATSTLSEALKPAPRFNDHFNNAHADANGQLATQQRYEAREKRMAKGGYGTPAEYYYLPLTKLKQLASNGDIYALLQLGQQYWDEPDKLATEAGFDARLSTDKLAVEYMSRAVLAGATQPVLTLAGRLSTTDPAEAYAWALFAEKLQLGGATEMAARLRTRLNDRELDAARNSADQKLGKMTQATIEADSTLPRIP